MDDWNYVSGYDVWCLRQYWQHWNRNFKRLDFRMLCDIYCINEINSAHACISFHSVSEVSHVVCNKNYWRTFITSAYSKICQKLNTNKIKRFIKFYLIDCGIGRRSPCSMSLYVRSNYPIYGNNPEIFNKEKILEGKLWTHILFE